MREIGKRDREVRNDLVIKNLKRKNIKFFIYYLVYFFYYSNIIVW